MDHHSVYVSPLLSKDRALMAMDQAREYLERNIRYMHSLSRGEHRHHFYRDGGDIAYLSALPGENGWRLRFEQISENGINQEHRAEVRRIAKGFHRAGLRRAA